MKGGIFSDQRCPQCNGRFKSFEPTGMRCPNHPTMSPSKFVVRFGNLTRRFKSYEDAYRCLTGWRYETDQGKFDSRDYKRSNPLGFDTLAVKWLSYKKEAVGYNHYRNLRNDIHKAISHWGAKNIKAIGYGEVEDFLYLQKSISSKTKSNLLSTLRDFFKWVAKREKRGGRSGFEMPELPEVSFKLGRRRIINKDLQAEVLDEVYRISRAINPKIHFAIQLLSTYISIRPGELINVKEADIDRGSGYIIVNSNKDREKHKVIPLIPRDTEAFKQYPIGLPHLFFFRHAKGNGAAKPGQRFGKDYLYKWWKKACANLGIEGVDLYGGTRHSSATALRKFRTPEEIKRATMHSTNKAFERYYRIEADDLRDIYSDTDNADNTLITKTGGRKKRNLL